MAMYELRNLMWIYILGLHTPKHMNERCSYDCVRPAVVIIYSVLIDITDSVAHKSALVALL